MTTKKVVIIILSVVSALVLLVVVFVAAILGFVFYQLGHSEAAVTAKAYLKSNEVLKRDIGDVRDFGSIVTGSINANNGDGAASLSLKVIGEKKTVNAEVDLIYKDGKDWRVTGARYKNDAGKTVELMSQFGSPPDSSPSPENEDSQ